MNFGEIKTELKSLINRKDFDLARAGAYVKRAVDRLEREVRLPFMERLVEYQLQGDDELILPEDFLELADIYTDAGRLKQVTMRQFFDTSNTGGVPKVFVKVRGVYKLRPTPAPETKVYLHYYGSEPTLAVDTDVNAWSLSGVDAVIYGAAELAADFFEDERLPRFAQKYTSSAAELAAQGERDAWAGPMSVAPAGQDLEY